MDMDCSFDAPMFVDFQNMEGEDQKREEAEAYFEIDHETDINAVVETSEYVSGNMPNMTNDQGTMAGSVVQGEKLKGNIAETAVDETNECVSQSLHKHIAQGSENKREALRRAVSETIEEIANSPKPKIPERRKTPIIHRLESKIRDAALPVPDPDCSPAVTRLRKTTSFKDRSRTPEILKQARQRKIEKHQQDPLPHASGSSSAIELKTTAKGFKEQLAKSRRVATSVSDPSVYSTLPPNTKMPSAAVNSCNSNVKQTKPLQPTKPAPFHFATNNRVKSDNNPIGANSENETGSAESCDPVNFQKMLRSYKLPEMNPFQNSRSTTRPQPFKASSKNTESSERRARNRSAEPSPRSSTNKLFQHINTSSSSTSSSLYQSKTRNASGESTYRSMAEQVIKFQTGTPDRYRSRPKRRSISTPNYGLKSSRGRSPSPLRCTQPFTPNLATRGRYRPPTALSMAEQEKMDLEQAKKNQFRARAVGEGVPKPRNQPLIESRSLTKPEPFNLTSARNRPAVNSQSEDHEFHAKPLNKRILNGPVGVPHRNAMPLIVPQSPAFLSRERLKDRERAEAQAKADAEQQSKRIIKAAPVPHYGVPVILPSVSKKTTTVAPFSFNDRDLMAQESKARKIDAVKEAEKKEKEFKAKPMPNLNKPIGLPNKHPAPPTEAQPFELLIEKRVEERKRKFEEEVENQYKQLREATKFKARPATVLEEAPFSTKPSEKPLSQIDPNFQLHSDIRAEARGEYDMLRRNKEAELDAVRREREERHKYEENLEIQKMRKEAVHKAQPVRHYKTVDIQRGEKPVTIPNSPKFAYEERKRRKIQEEVEVEVRDEESRPSLNDTFDI